MNYKYAPNFYRPMADLPGILGPLRWQDETSGQLPAAVAAFFGVQGAEPLTLKHLEMVREYAEYYINAPCWDTRGDEETWASLRQRIKMVSTRPEMDAWLHDAASVTIDPF